MCEFGVRNSSYAKALASWRPLPLLAEKGRSRLAALVGSGTLSLAGATEPCDSAGTARP